MISLLHALFPQKCLHCYGRNHDNAFGLCPTCIKDLKRIGNHCPLCGFEHNFKHQICGRCLKTDQHPIDQMVIGYHYDAILSSLIIQMKFSKKPYIAQLCLKLMAPFIDDLKIRRSSDYVLIPMPTDRFRLANRGFNPALEFARTIEKTSNFTIDSTIIYKRSFFIPQSKLDKKARLSNLKNAFVIKKPPPKKVILIDDVLTTGTTLNTAASLLKKQGCETIIALIIAKA